MSQIWKPDTCDCVIEQVFDYSVDPPVLASQQIIKACKFHATPVEVLTENITKNQGSAIVAVTLGVLDSDVQYVIDDKRDIIYYTEVKTVQASEKLAIDTALATISPKLSLATQKPAQVVK